MEYKEAMKLFTVSEGKVEEGALVRRYTLQDAGITVPAILIGESGRGRKLGVMPVELLPGQREEWEKEGRVIVYSGKIGQTKSGRPKLIATETHETNDYILTVLRTPIGYRGSNEHTGDRISKEVKEFLPFPGEVLVEGIIAQGDAGYMGSGHQYIAVIPRGVVFRTRYSGRLYGKPPAHYYLWDGERLLAATWEERQLFDLF